MCVLFILYMYCICIYEYTNLWLGDMRSCVYLPYSLQAHITLAIIINCAKVLFVPSSSSVLRCSRAARVHACANPQINNAERHMHISMYSQGGQPQTPHRRF